MHKQRILIGTIACLAVALLLVGPTVVRGEVRPLLAVMDVQDGDGVLESAVTNNLTEYLRGLLAETGRYVVIDRGRQAAAVKQLVRHEKKESYKACYDRSCQVPLGRSLAADRILITSLMRIGSRVIVKAEIVDLATEASQGGATVKVKSEPAGGLEDRLTEALDELVVKLVGSTEQAPQRPLEESAASAVDGGHRYVGLGEQAESQHEEWVRLTTLVENTRIPAAARVAAIDEFSNQVGPDSPYALEARELRECVAGSPSYYRTKTEWSALSINVSTMGLGFNAGFFTLRWDNFYLQLLQGGWTEAVDDAVYSGSVGLSMGYPLFLGSAGRHELRFGADVDLWIYLYDFYEDSYTHEETGEFIGTGITPRVTYIFHVARHFSIQAGMEAILALIPWDSSDDFQATFAGSLGVGF